MTCSLSSRIQSQHVVQLGVPLKKERRRIVLDLKEIILVNREAVGFLAACETKGSELKNLSGFRTRVDPKGKTIS
jgi:hypothetical protein